MQLHLRSFYNNLGQQNSFERTLEHQKRFNETQTFLNEQIFITFLDLFSNKFLELAQHFYNHIKAQIK